MKTKAKKKNKNTLTKYDKGKEQRLTTNIKPQQADIQPTSPQLPPFIHFLGAPPTCCWRHSKPVQHPPCQGLHAVESGFFSVWVCHFCAEKLYTLPILESRRAKTHRGSHGFRIKVGRYYTTMCYIRT